MFNIMTKEDFDSSEVKVDAYMSVMKSDKRNFLELTDSDGYSTYAIAYPFSKRNPVLLSIEIGKVYKEVFDTLVEFKHSSAAIELYIHQTYSIDSYYPSVINEYRKFQNENDVDITLIIDYSNLNDYNRAKLVNPKVTSFIKATYGKPRAIKSQSTDNKPKQSGESIPFPSGLICERLEIPKSVELKILKTGRPFSEYISELLKSKHMKSEEVYKRANLTRKYFSKLMNDEIKKPSKEKLMMLAVGFEMSFDEAEDLLKFMGYAFSYNELTDVIFEYYLTEKEYDSINIAIEIFGRTQKCIFGDE